MPGRVPCPTILFGNATERSIPHFSWYHERVNSRLFFGNTPVIRCRAHFSRQSNAEIAIS